jgi:hypothetical protein
MTISVNGPMSSSLHPASQPGWIQCPGEGAAFAMAGPAHFRGPLGHTGADRSAGRLGAHEGTNGHGA